MSMYPIEELDPDVLANMPVPDGYPKCRVCGCWEYNPCDDMGLGPCFWIEQDDEKGWLCSACEFGEPGDPPYRPEDP